MSDSARIVGRLEKTGSLKPASKLKRTVAFDYFEDDDRYVIVVPDRVKSRAGEALARGLKWRGDKRLVLVLPHDSAFATLQRATCLTPDARPEVYLHERGRLKSGEASIGRDEAVANVVAKAKGEPEEELRVATTPLHLGSKRNARLAGLTEWATEHPLLDSSHRKGYRSWQHMGQQVLQIKAEGAGISILAGINERRKLRPTRLKPDEDLSVEQFTAIRGAVEQAIKYRSTPELKTAYGRTFCVPDEGWLQAVLRADPRLAGVEQPALREVPCWRPKSGVNDPDENLEETDEGSAKKDTRWLRGRVDLVGLDGNGDIRIVETKLAKNDDYMMILQGLDYYLWATAYEKALQRRLGVRDVPIKLCFLVGATPTAPGSAKEALKAPSYAKEQLAAVSPNIPMLFLVTEGWFTPGARPREAKTTDARDAFATS